MDLYQSVWILDNNMFGIVSLYGDTIDIFKNERYTQSLVLQYNTLVNQIIVVNNNIIVATNIGSIHIYKNNLHMELKLAELDILDLIEIDNYRFASRTLDDVINIFDLNLNELFKLQLTNIISWKILNNYLIVFTNSEIILIELNYYSVKTYFNFDNLNIISILTVNIYNNNSLLVTLLNTNITTCYKIFDFNDNEVKIKDLFTIPIYTHTVLKCLNDKAFLLIGEEKNNYQVWINTAKIWYPLENKITNLEIDFLNVYTTNKKNAYTCDDGSNLLLVSNDMFFNLLLYKRVSLLPEWSYETHKYYPIIFKNQVKTLLLILNKKLKLDLTTITGFLNNIVKHLLPYNNIVNDLLPYNNIVTI
jgi:hypothetical protein